MRVCVCRGVSGEIQRVFRSDAEYVCVRLPHQPFAGEFRREGLLAAHCIVKDDSHPDCSLAAGCCELLRQHQERVVAADELLPFGAVNRQIGRYRERAGIAAVRPCASGQVIFSRRIDILESDALQRAGGHGLARLDFDARKQVLERQRHGGVLVAGLVLHIACGEHEVLLMRYI